MTLHRSVVVVVPLLLVASPVLTFAIGPQWASPVGMGPVLGGNSMAPTLCTGDLVIYRDGTPIEEGDVITFHNGRGPIPVTTHRVVAVTDNGYLTQGDNEERSDYRVIGYVQREEVIGEVFLVLSVRNCRGDPGETRLADRSPPDQSGGNPLLDRWGEWSPGHTPATARPSRST